MPFAGVDDGPAAVAEGGQHGPGRLDRAAQARDVVAQGLPEATGLDEVPLEVDAHQGDVRRVQRVREGLRWNGDHPDLLLPRCTAPGELPRPAWSGTVMEVPARPASASRSRGSEVMTARRPPPSRNCRADSIFGPMEPAGNSPASRWPRASAGRRSARAR